MKQLQIGPFMGVVQDQKVKYPNQNELRFISYTAYNAQGLIGPEKNGFAILDEINKSVVCDEIAKVDGFNRRKEPFANMSDMQVIEKLTSMTWNDVCDLVNTSDRARMLLVKDVEVDIAQSLILNSSLKISSPTI